MKQKPVVVIGALLAALLIGASSYAGLARADAPGDFIRLEGTKAFIEELRNAPRHLESELGADFKDRMQPEIDRFGKLLVTRIASAEDVGLIDEAVSASAAAPVEADVLADAADRIAGRREAWAQAEAKGENAAFLKASETDYAARTDKETFEKLVERRVAVDLAHENAKALNVFTRILRTVLLDGPERLSKAAKAELHEGIGRLYDASDADMPGIALSRDVEKGRQRIVLLSLDPEQVKRLVAFYESPGGRQWSEALGKAYEAQLRKLTADVTMAYIDAVTRPDR